MSNHEQHLDALTVGQSRRRLALAVAVVLSAWLLASVIFFDGPHGSDDFHHIRFAYFWDHVPHDHWESRLLYNAALRTSYRVLGYSPWATAVPGMLGTLMLLSAGMLLAWKNTGSIGVVLLTGLLLAFTPIVVGTGGSPKPLAAGLLGVAVAVFLLGRGWPSILGAGLLLAMGCWTHVSTIFFMGIFPLTMWLFRRRRLSHCLSLLAVSVAVFLVAEFGTFYLWTGDPLYGFRIASATHLANLENEPNYLARLTEGGPLSLGFIWIPVRDLLGCIAFGPLGLVALGGAALTWRRLTSQSRLMLALALLTWAWMSYGTQTPTRYAPFPGTAAYWYPLLLPLALVAGEAIARIRRQGVRAAILSVVILADIGLLSLAGPWGQSVMTSRELLAYARVHPRTTFVADNMTLTEMYVVNQFQELPNIRRLPGTAQPKFVSVEELGTRAGEEQADGPVLALVNRLNQRDGNTSYDRLAGQLGEVLYEGEASYRMATYLLPAGYRAGHAWTLRRPPAEVRRFRLIASDSASQPTSAPFSRNSSEPVQGFRPAQGAVP